MNIMRTKIEMKTYQRKNGYPLSYYASETDLINPKFRSASPANKMTEYGTFRNGRITSMRKYGNES
jgi:hypothetical protein